MSRRVMFLTRSWPRLSQTFVVNEVLALERRGVELEIFAMTAADEAITQPQVALVRADVTYLDADPDGDLLAEARELVAARAPDAYADTARFAAERPDLSAGYATATTLECLDHAVRIAARWFRLRDAGVEIDHLHAHFAHDPALVALLVSRLTGISYTVTGHARDIYQIPGENLEARIAEAEVLLTCCANNVDFLRDTLTADTFAKVRLIHHGIDLRQFSPLDTDAAHRTPQIVSVGRLVEKKGYPDLLRACAEVAAAGTVFTLTIYGDGPLRAELEALRDELGLAGHVVLAGEHDSTVIVDAMRRADVFALTPFVTADGDRDGVPNVIVEALACGLPVVSTRAVGVAEAVDDRVNGILVEPHDVAAIAGALRELVADPDLRRAFGEAARAKAEAAFDVDRAAERLVGIFGASEVRA